MFWSEALGVDMSVFMTEQSSTFSHFSHGRMAKICTTYCKKRTFSERDDEAPRYPNK